MFDKDEIQIGDWVRAIYDAGHNAFHESAFRGIWLDRDGRSHTEMHDTQALKNAGYYVYEGKVIGFSDNHKTVVFVGNYQGCIAWAAICEHVAYLCSCGNRRDADDYACEGCRG